MERYSLKFIVEGSPFKKSSLAAMLGVPQYTFSNYLTGRTRIPEGKLDRLIEIIAAGRKLITSFETVLPPSPEDLVADKLSQLGPG